MNDCVALFVAWERFLIKINCFFIFTIVSKLSAHDTALMKLSDWFLLDMNDVVACTSRWLCSCLLSFGWFDWYLNWFFIFQQLVPWLLFHLLLLDVWPWDYSTLIWCWVYFCATIYYAALPPTVILFVVINPSFSID